MAWTGRLPIINVETLPHGLQEQLKKQTGGSVGYDIYLPEDIVVPRKTDQNEAGQYKWEEVTLLSQYGADVQKQIIKDAALGIGVDGEVPAELVGSGIAIVGIDEKVADKSFLLAMKENNLMVYRKRFNPLLFRTGFRLPPQAGGSEVWYALFPRSGASVYYDVALANGVGVVDPDYPDEVLLALEAGVVQQAFRKGERIAQLIVMENVPSQLNKTREGEIHPLDQMGEDYGGAITDWGGNAPFLPSMPRAGGFGSTGLR